MRDQCLELLGESARATANKLKFFRLAFGAGGGFGDEIDAHEAKMALKAVRADAGPNSAGWSPTRSCPRARSSCCSIWR